jgi:hypothetical protein
MSDNQKTDFEIQIAESIVFCDGIKVSMPQ